MRRQTEETFWAKVQKTESTQDCWNWQSATCQSRGRDFYGIVKWHGGNEPAHKKAFELTVGKVLQGQVIDHLCKNTRCVNPWHLEPVTYKESVRRSSSPVGQNANKTHCTNGHKFTPENTRIQVTRICRCCESNKLRS